MQVVELLHEGLQDDNLQANVKLNRYKKDFEIILKEKQTLEVTLPSSVSRSHCVVKVEAVRRTEEIQSLKRSIDIKEDEYSSLKVRITRS